MGRNTTAGEAIRASAVPAHAGAARAARGCRRPRVRGFTYLGVLVLAAVMGAAAGAWVQLWHVAQTREKERELLFVGHQFRQALGSWQRRGQAGPRQLEELLADPRTPTLQRHLRRIHVDPITGRAEWGLVKDEGGGIVAVHSLSRSAPLKKAGFAARDREFENATRYSEWVFAPLPAAGGERGPRRVEAVAGPQQRESEHE